MRTIKYLVLAVAAAALLALPGTAAAKSRDRDHDRLPDKWEKRHHFSTHKKSARGDADHDSLSNLAEYRSKTNPRRKDSDRDGILDDDEDRDRDGVDNGNEARERTNPRRKDSDRDGIRDGKEDRDRDGLDNRGEDRSGNDPMDPDSDDDGVKDGDEDAGTVASFDGTTLVINVAGGGQVSGVVDSRTEIKCEDEDDAEDGDGHHSAAKSDRGPGHDGDDRGDDDHSGPGRDGDEDHSGPGRGDDEHERECGTDQLVPGARVHEAELDLTSAGPVWDEVELISAG
jgi:hypothetical protein